MSSEGFPRGGHGNQKRQEGKSKVGGLVLSQSTRAELIIAEFELNPLSCICKRIDDTIPEVVAIETGQLCWCRSNSETAHFGIHPEYASVYDLIERLADQIVNKFAQLKDFSNLRLNELYLAIGRCGQISDLKRVVWRYIDLFDGEILKLPPQLTSA